MPGKVDHSGSVYGSWTLLKIASMRPKKYLCKCSCGNESEVFHSNLTRGLSTRCAKCQSLGSTEEFVGKKFHHLTILGFVKVNGKKMAIVLCDCGNQTQLQFGQINKKSESCIAYKYSSCGKCNLNNRKNIKKYHIIGEKYGMLKILENIGKDLSLAECDCGNITQVKKWHLLNEKPSCGCYWKNIHIENAKKLEGIKYYYLKIVKFLRMDGKNLRALYLVKCKCGKEFERSVSYLFGSKSCGCIRKDLADKGLMGCGRKLKDYEAKSIRQLAETKLYLQRDLAKMFNVNETIISSVIRRKTYRHIKD